ncbi:MAG: hypothetical protein CSA11_02985 [Chloroflexi bacterium]|nr:MAG: hypothetical protein CSA11_02985 [Chloroflexota bacterium]
MEERALIHFKNVSKKLGGINRIDDLTASFEKGKVYGLIGPNGAGKTTFFNLLTGIYKSDKGKISVAGLDPVRDYKKVRSLIGFAPQDTALYPELSAKDNLMYHAALYLDSMKNVKDKINSILELVELSNRANEPVKNFSGGMKRRLSIGRAILSEPEILLLDEPTLGVDVQSTHRIWEYIKGIREKDTVIIVATNVMAEADFLSDEIVLLDRGKKIADGSLDDLKKTFGDSTITICLKDKVPNELLFSKFKNIREIRDKEVVFNTKNIVKDLTAVVDTLSNVSEIENIKFEKPSLDDFFLAKTGKKLRD